jgi:hypothetical protein
MTSVKLVIFLLVVTFSMTSLAQNNCRDVLTDLGNGGFNPILLEIAPLLSGKDSFDGARTIIEKLLADPANNTSTNQTVLIDVLLNTNMYPFARWAWETNYPFNSAAQLVGQLSMDFPDVQTKQLKFVEKLLNYDDPDTQAAAGITIAGMIAQAHAADQQIAILRVLKKQFDLSLVGHRGTNISGLASFANNVASIKPISQIVTQQKATLYKPIYNYWFYLSHQFSPAKELLSALEKALASIEKP